MAIATSRKPISTSIEGAIGGFAVTPHDTNLFPTLARGLYIGGAGDVTVTGQDDTDVTFVGVPAGSMMGIRCKRVKATGTTATNIVALY